MTTDCPPSWEQIASTNSVSITMNTTLGMCEAVIRGQLPVAWISGPPGVGKNIAVNAAADAAGKARIIKCNPRTYEDLLKQLSEAANRKAVIWLDEADVIFRSDRMVNLLKTATGSPRDRVYNGVNVNAPIIVTTNGNLDPNAPGTCWDKKLTIHADALFNRSAPVMIPEGRMELWEYALLLAATGKMLREDSDGDGIALAIRQQAVEWFTANFHNLANVSPRTLAKAADFMSRSRKKCPTLTPAVAEFQLKNMVTGGSTETPPPMPIIDWWPSSAAAGQSGQRSSPASDDLLMNAVITTMAQ